MNATSVESKINLTFETNGALSDFISMSSSIQVCLKDGNAFRFTLRHFYQEGARNPSLYYDQLAYCLDPQVLLSEFPILRENTTWSMPIFRRINPRMMSSNGRFAFWPENSVNATEFGRLQSI